MYSKSMKALNRVKNELDQMVNANGATLQFLTTNPTKLAFQIREGINVARSRANDTLSPNHAQFIAYAGLRAKYIVRTGESVVIAEPRDVLLETPQQVLSKQVLPDLTTDMEIVGAAIVNKAREMFFPDATDDTQHLLVIHAWATKNGYFLVTSEDGLTLTTTDPGEIAWHPKQNES